jgi:hypothetical protein
MSRIIAIYLPQYHSIPENDDWWGPGFTEWVNVAQARALFSGHKQPHIPADIGFYNLLIPETREAQAELAREAGIEGFCYWHYWFGNGKQLLERPFNEVVDSGTPDFPFCLGWANHSWYKKRWGVELGKDQLLIEQTYPGEKDHILHFYSFLKAFKDERYIRVNGKLFFLIYLPLEIPDVKNFISLWRKLAKENGLNDFYFVGQQYSGKDSEKILELGFDALSNRSLINIHDKASLFTKATKRLASKVFKIPLIYKYSKAIKCCHSELDRKINRIPGLYPNWDHTPRSKHKGLVLKGSNPELFYMHAIETLNLVKDKPKENQIILLSSWNEWGEGNYMEPDREFGKGYIYSLRKAIDKFVHIDNNSTT